MEVGGSTMNDLLTRRGNSEAVGGCASPAQEREAQRNRLCELRQSPTFNEWWQLTLELGPEDCLLLLTSELAAAPPGDTAALARALAALSRTLSSATAGGEDRWVNPLFPLPQPDAPVALPLPLAARLDTLAASAD